ncbi:DUF6011 domain-containing protein [Mycolicibacterium sp. CBMA 226]|uniref:DUF6011 domain-containing protein n=1 Tax=Mycolicibacterium sp. CBMA 226 TaxID=2606611 RepID=UPI0037C69CAF
METKEKCPGSATQALPDNTTTNPEYSLLRSVRCHRCGLRLTAPKSVAAQIGPVCRGKTTTHG